MSRTFVQIARYCIVGVVSKAALYLAYLILTYLGVGHKSAMTLLYIVGVLQTYYANRSWTFAHGGSVAVSLPRYVGAYVSGYLINLGGLLILTDVLGFPHQIVQGVLIFVVAGYLFVLQRLWVFPPHRHGATQEA